MMNVQPVNVVLGILAHLCNLDPVICRDGTNGGDEADKVDRRETIAKDESGSDKSDNLLADASNREGNDRGALQQGELADGHQKGNAAWKEENERSLEVAAVGDEAGKAMEQADGALDWDGDAEKGDEHDRREEEDGRERVRCGRVAQEEDLGQAPAEA